MVKSAMALAIIATAFFALMPSLASAASTGQISGTVTAASGGAAIEGVEVCASDASGGFGGCAWTNASGEYTISGLATGSYKVEFRPGYTCTESGCTSQNYLYQYYNGKSSWEEADLVSVAEGSVTEDINAAMQEAGQVTGVVTNATTHAAIEGMEVCAQGAGGGYWGNCGRTNAAGEYTIMGLATGSYVVSFTGTVCSEAGCTEEVFAPQYYNGKSSWEEADPVAVTAGAVTANINVQMQLGPLVRQPHNRSISPGSIVAFPGSLPAVKTAGDSVTLNRVGGGSAAAILLHWGANGIVLRIPASTSAGEYELTVTDEERSSTITFTLTAPTVSSETITPLSNSGISSLPLGVAEDHSGDVWFSDAASNSIGELVGGAGGAVREFPLLTANSGPTGIAVDQEGNVWVADNLTGKVTELDTAHASPGTTNGETEFTLAAGAEPDQLSVDPYGNIWVAEGDAVLGRISAAPPEGSRSLREWSIGCDLEGMTVDPFGNVWAVDECEGIDQVVPSQLPAPTTAQTVTSGVYHVAGSGGDEQIAVAPNGDVWFTQWGPPVLGVIVPSATNPAQDQTFTAANYPQSGEAPSGIDVDAAGNVFIADAAAQAIYKFAPSSFAGGEASGVWTEYQVGSWMTNYSEGDEGNNLAVTPAGNVVFSGYVTNGPTYGTPYLSSEFIQGYIGTLPGVAVPATETGKFISGGHTTEEIVSGTSGDEVIIPAGTEVTTGGGTPFEGTIPSPVANPSFVPAESAEFGSPLEGSAFSVSPELSGGDVAHVVFSKPVTVTFTFPLPEGTTAAEAEETKIYYYNPSTLEWVEAGIDAGDPGGTVTVHGGEVTVTLVTYHLSSFAALAHTTTSPAISSVTPAAALAGEAIVVRGSNLGTAMGHATLTPTGATGGAVVSLPLESWSASQVTAKVPSAQAAGTYTVALKTAGGTVTNSLALEVVPPAPSAIPPSASPRPSVAVAAGVAIARASVKVKGAAALISLYCEGAGRCEGRLTLTAKVTQNGRKHHGKRRTLRQARGIVIGTSDFSIAAATTAMVKVTLSGRGKRLLAKAGKRGLRVKLGGVDVKSRSLVLKNAAAEGAAHASQRRTRQRRNTR